MNLNRAGLLLLALLLSLQSAMANQPVKVEIHGDPGSYQLYRDGRPYRIRGVGTGLVKDLASVEAYGGNSVRTWNTGDGSLLDRAHELGLTVALCLDVKRERHGFDYGDPTAVRRQFEVMREEVLKYRHHPALLVWMIGNELNMDYTDSRVYDAVNDISKMIHELDPNHPTTTTTAGMSVELAQDIQARAPDLDFISVQYYGGLESLPAMLDKAGIQKPVMVTEWGTIGHWEVDETPWGAPLELNSSEKAAFFLRSHEQVLQPLTRAGRVIGDYVFLWGHKQERTPTWYGLFTPVGLRTEAVDVMQRIWTGQWPEDRTPRMVSLLLNSKPASTGVQLVAGQSVAARALVEDAEQEALDYQWQVMEESQATQIGGDPEAVPPTFEGLVQGEGDSIRLTVPAEPGAYRLYVYAADQGGGAAHANVPFIVVSNAMEATEKTAESK